MLPLLASSDLLLLWLLLLLLFLLLLLEVVVVVVVVIVIIVVAFTVYIRRPPLPPPPRRQHLFFGSCCCDIHSCECVFRFRSYFLPYCCFFHSFLFRFVSLALLQYLFTFAVFGRLYRFVGWMWKVEGGWVAMVDVAEIWLGVGKATSCALIFEWGRESEYILCPCQRQCQCQFPAIVAYFFTLY